MNCATQKAAPPEPPRPSFIDNFKLHRHRPDDAAPIYACHHCGRQALTLDQLEVLMLPDPGTGEMQPIGPSNICKPCWSAFQQKAAVAAAGRAKAPWPPAWSVALYEEKQAAQGTNSPKPAASKSRRQHSPNSGLEEGLAPAPGAPYCLFEV